MSIKIVSKCKKCGANLHTKELLDHLISEGKAHILKDLQCPKCGTFTQVLDKPYTAE